jgi:transposase
MLEEIKDSLSPAKAAKILGVHVGTIHRWMMSGVRGQVLPSLLVGGRRRILMNQLKAFLSTGGSVARDMNRDHGEVVNRHRAAEAHLRSFGVRIDRKGRS